MSEYETKMMRKSSPLDVPGLLPEEEMSYKEQREFIEGAISGQLDETYETHEAAVTKRDPQGIDQLRLQVPFEGNPRGANLTLVRRFEDEGTDQEHRIVYMILNIRGEEMYWRFDDGTDRDSLLTPCYKGEDSQIRSRPSPEPGSGQYDPQADVEVARVGKTLIGDLQTKYAEMPSRSARREGQRPVAKSREKSTKRGRSILGLLGIGHRGRT